MAGGSGCRSESWLAVKLGLTLKLGWELKWELEWELESELELKPQPERELEWELELRPLKLDKYGGHPQNPDLGPKWQYVLVNPPLKPPSGDVFGATFQKRKMCHSHGATQLYNPNFHSGFLIKNAFARNLRPAIHVGTPHFHRFPSY